MTGYTRSYTKNTNDTIEASDFNTEYQAIDDAMDAATGHKHDGTADEGAPITKVGPAQELIVASTSVTPKTDNTVDLGSTTLEFKDLYVDGVGYIDGLNTDAITLGGVLITSTAAQLNYTNGVTSAIQTQLDAKAPVANPSFTGTITMDNGVVTQKLATYVSANNKYGFGIGVAQHITYRPSNASVTWGTISTADGTTYAEQMRLNSSGFLGIGTTNPLSQLHVSAASPRLLLTDTDTGADCRVNADSNTGNLILEADINNEVAASAVTFTVDGTERMRVNDSGNVGIGTTSPAIPLDVNADSIRIRTAQTPATAGATGVQGEIAWDENYIYVCIDTNTWKRAELSTW